VKLVQPGAEKLRSADEITPRHQQRPLEDPRPLVKDRERVPCRVFEQHRREMFQGRHIADQERHRACSFGQHVTQRNRMIERPSFFDSALNGPHGLVRKSLNP
jgi:hypothetical protein